jgi:hypothetical protein
MKSLLLAATAVVLITSAASAQGTTRFYSSSGKSLGSATTYGNTTNYRARRSTHRCGALVVGASEKMKKPDAT